MVKENHADATDDDMLIVGSICGIYGVRGWVKLFSHTKPRENILSYQPLYLKLGGKWQARKLITGRVQGKGVVAQFEGVDDREQVRELLDVEIAIARSQLPKPAKDEYYWTDLIGLEVVTDQGESLGKIDHLFETGANDVIAVKGDRERLIPFVQGDVIKEIDLEGGKMTVDWDPEF